MDRVGLCLPIHQDRSTRDLEAQHELQHLACAAPRCRAAIDRAAGRSSIRAGSDTPYAAGRRCNSNSNSCSPNVEQYCDHEATRLCLKHLRQRGMLDAFHAIQQQSHTQLEHPLITELFHRLVRWQQQPQQQHIGNNDSCSCSFVVARW